MQIVLDLLYLHAQMHWIAAICGYNNVRLNSCTLRMYQGVYIEASSLFEKQHNGIFYA